MKSKPSLYLEGRRIKSGYLVSDASYGNNGAFELIDGDGAALLAIVSDQLGWEHVSVTVLGQKRCPTWEEMCWVKQLFWKDTETVIQMHVPKERWISNHPYCLHLWRPIGTEIPLPPMNLVGTQKFSVLPSHA